jgi:hypothetical protein
VRKRRFLQVDAHWQNIKHFGLQKPVAIALRLAIGLRNEG